MGAVVRPILTSTFLVVLALLMFPLGVAQGEPDADAGAVAGSWKVDTFDQNNSNPDPASCWTLAVGDTLTITEVGTEKLALTLPSGEAWHLVPYPPGFDETDVRFKSRWISNDEDTAQAQGSVLEYHGDFIRVKLQRQLNPRDWTGCQAFVSALRSGDDSGPIALVKDPATRRWVPWVLVPGVGWVIYVVAKKALKKPNKNQAKNNQEDRRQYLLDLGTQDNRTNLSADGEDLLWVYAQVRCNRPEVDTAALTAALTFAPEGADANWLMLGTPVMANGFQTVPVRAWPPTPDAELTDKDVTVVVWTYPEGQPLSARVPLTINAFALRIY